MSVSYSSYAVIGVKIDPKKLVITEKVRNCSCEVKNIEKKKFCSSCGKKVFVEEDTYIPQYDDDAHKKDFPFYYSLCGFPLIYNTDNIDAFVAFICCECDDYNDNPFSDLSNINIEEVKTKMREKLEPMGLWNEENFGLWAVQYCSY